MSLRVSEYQRTVSDVISWYQDRALSTRILLLHPTGPAGFVLMDTEDEQKYKVLLGDPHMCSCKTFKKEKVPCKHICWILLKKFKVPRTDPISFQHGLVERELQAVLSGFFYKKTAAEKKTTTPATLQQTAAAGDDGVLRQRAIAEDDSCPICQEEFLGAGTNSSNNSHDEGSKPVPPAVTHHEPVTYCKYGCGQNVHIRCMKVWATYQKSTVKDTLECPLCRADFGTLRSLMEELHNAQGDLGRNGGNQARGQRSTVHQFSCYNCGLTPIEGKCYKCRSCTSFYLCQQCFTNKIHMHHSFDMRQKTKERWVPVDRGFLLVGNNNDNNSCSVQQRMLELGLENRDITENDYDLLMQLDQSDVPNNPAGVEIGATLSEHEVSLLPSMVIKKQHVHLLKPGMQCNLCLQNYRVGQSIRRLTCRHKFHQNCLDGYLLHQSNCCPICHEIVEINSSRPTNQNTETHSQISSFSKSQINQKGQRPKNNENQLRDLGSRKSNKERVLSFHGNDSQLEAILTVFGQSDAQVVSGLPPFSSNSGKKKTTTAGNNNQQHLERNKVLANRGRQHSHDSLGFGNTPKGPVFDTSLTVSSVMNLQTKPNSNLARKACLPKNLRGLKNSLINDQLETSDMHLMTSLYGNERDSKELPDLRVGSKNDNRLGHPGNLHALEKRHKMRKGSNGIPPKSSFTSSALLDIVGDPLSHVPNPRSRSSLRKETEVTSIRRRSNSLDRLEKRRAREVTTPFSDIVSCDDLFVDDNAIANVSLANQFL